MHSATQWWTQRMWLPQEWLHRLQVTSVTPWLLILYISNYANVPVPGWRKCSELEEGQTDWDQTCWHWVAESFSLFFLSSENNSAFTQSTLCHLKTVTSLVIARGLRKFLKTAVRNRYGLSWDLWLGAPQSASRQIDPAFMAANQ